MTMSPAILEQKRELEKSCIDALIDELGLPVVEQSELPVSAVATTTEMDLLSEPSVVRGNWHNGAKRSSDTRVNYPRWPVRHFLAFGPPSVSRVRRAKHLATQKKNMSREGKGRPSLKQKDFRAD